MFVKPSSTWSMIPQQSIVYSVNGIAGDVIFAVLYLVALSGKI